MGSDLSGVAGLVDRRPVLTAPRDCIKYQKAMGQNQWMDAVTRHDKIEETVKSGKDKSIAICLGWKSALLAKRL
jgi:hypothetical protein